jgi:hypothetical protein
MVPRLINEDFSTPEKDRFLVFKELSILDGNRYVLFRLVDSRRKSVCSALSSIRLSVNKTKMKGKCISVVNSRACWLQLKTEGHLSFASS